MHEMEITLEAVKAKLAKLKINKSPGGDQLHPRVLSETREQIAEPLLMIFRNSLLTRAGSCGLEVSRSGGPA